MPTRPHPWQPPAAFNFIATLITFGAAIGLARLQITVIPIHLADQGVRNVLIDRARRQQMNRIPHFGDFRKHHGGAGADQKIGGKTQGRIGSNS